MNKNDKIYVAGHRGLVGSAILRRLEAGGYGNIVVKTHARLDLTRQAEVEAFFEAERPDYVFLGAAKVGGIGANSAFPAQFIYVNLAIGLNLIHAAHRYKVKKLLNLGSSCIYPRLAPQPLKEEYFMTGPLESTNEAYALAKIAAIRLCRHYNEQYGTNFLSVMPTNMYGLGDNYDPEGSHVLPGMIRKFHEAKLARREVTLWGDGSPFREFLHADDCADALVFLMEGYDASDLGEFINLGTGEELRVRELAARVAKAVGFEGGIRWDASKPNGTPRKLLDSSRLSALGWRPRIGLDEGLKGAYEDFLRTAAG
ncbi:MAG: GDP-L-fucose synthase family protein [Rectinemataceae bacterium]